MASDMGDMCREMREQSKINRKELEEKNTEIIKGWCEEVGAEFEEIESYHIRVKINGSKLDIFPQSKKYHDITKGERGRIVGRIYTFLNEYLNNF